ncbi:MAG TPA: hypothetical protein VJ276_20300 [Thermoanaerobaculia bacterium]|nr:hypothetical protein [Thermoanaerobaculia bacterium]
MSSFDSTPNLSASGVFDLAVRIAGEDLTGLGPPDIPWGSNASEESFAAAIEPAIDYMPLAYQQAYVTPVQQNLSRLAIASPGGGDPAETVLGAIYDHGPGSEVGPPLRRFLAVVSDLYESFLSREKRLSLDLPLIEQLPPLATFRNDGSLGPYTYTVDIVQQMIGAPIALVSVPSVYRNHPLLWGSLAHETGGHDVVHADPGLIQELQSGGGNVMLAVAAASAWPQSGPLLSTLWQYWMNEATADVFGVLNIGPAFALNLSAWLMALRAQLGQTTLPHLLTTSGTIEGNALDIHPTDILRVDLAIGAIHALRSLDPAVKATYIDVLRQVAEVAAGGATSIGLDGYISVGDDASFPLSTTLPLPLMRTCASALGAFIVTAPFQAFDGKSIQDIETWDDIDEAAARMIFSRAHARAAAAIGDPALILAGGTLAAVHNPAAYDLVNEMIAGALDIAAARDPFWGRPRFQTHSPQKEEVTVNV